MNKIDEKIIVAKAYQLGMVALLISIVFLIFAYLGIGYTTNDETNIELGALSDSSLSNIVHSAMGQGRIYQIIQGVIAYSPYWIAKILGTYDKFFLNLIFLASVLASLTLLSLTIYKVTQQKLFALLVAVFSIAAIQNSWSHNVLTSYTFAMNFPIILLLSSLILFLDYLTSGKKLFLVLSYITFLLTLFSSYEFFFFYVAIFMFIAFFNTQITTTSNKAILSMLYTSSLHLIAVMVFLTAYFMFRRFYPSGYGGAQVVTQFSGINIINILRVIYQYTVSSFPTYIYFHYSDLFNFYSDHVQGHSYAIGSLVEQMKADWLIKSAVVAYFVYVLLQNRLVTISRKMFIGLSLVSIYIMIVPNILVAITGKYQSWVQHSNSLLHTTTYFSYFGTVLLIVSGIVFFNQIFYINTLRIIILRKLYVYLITIAIAFMSLATDYSNYYVFKEQKISQQKWVVLDTFVQSGNLDSVPAGSFIYAPSLFNARGIVANFSNYWTDYINLKYKKAVIVSNSVEELNDRLAQQKFNNLYYLKLSQEPKDMHQFILFSKVQKVINNNIFLSSDAVIVSNSNRKKFLIFGRNLLINIDTLTPSATNVAVLIDNELAQRDGNFFSKSIDKQQTKNHYTSTHLKTAGDAVLDLESISISSYVDHKLYLYKIDNTDCFQPGIVFHLGQGSTLPCELNYILPTGWSGLEHWGVWSHANPEMQIDLPKDCQGNTECNLKLLLAQGGVFNTSIAKPKRVLAKINDQLIGEWSMNGQQTIDISLNYKILHGQIKNIKIKFSIPDAESPKQAGISEDLRILGIGLSAYQIVKRNTN